jgi:methylenetetrahydrofolate reductase (NADPH)
MVMTRPRSSERPAAAGKPEGPAGEDQRGAAAARAAAERPAGERPEGAAERPAAAAGSLLAALRRPRYEVLPLDGVVDAVEENVPREVKVTVTASPTRGLESTLDVATQLATRGYEVVPHLSARLVRDRRHLDEIVERLRATGIDDVFVIAGDARHAAGDFPDAVSLLRAMGEARHGFADRGISGYPESHHFISDETTIEAMFAKEPMATYIVSQICFDPDTIATWVKRVRDRGTLLPIWVGVPGAVTNRKLLRTSLKIGLGESARFLGTHRGWLSRLALRRRYAPTDLLEQLQPTFEDPAGRLGGIHVYTFNELERTERWRRQLIDRLTTRR